MKRTALKRRTPLRSRPPVRPTPAEREPRAVVLTPATRAATYAGTTTGEPVHKENAVRSEEYRRLIAQMPCKHCGITGYTQAAHPNTDKGASLKTDDRECFPLCTVHPSPGGGGWVRGCHERFDQGALYEKHARRMLEPAWAADTRRYIQAAGLWPKNLPLWND